MLKHYSLFSLCVLLFLSACKKDKSDPNLAFTSLGLLEAYGGAAPAVPYFMATGGYSLAVKNKYLGLQNCKNPSSPGPFFSDSTIRCNLLSVFRDQDQKTFITPGKPIWINDTSTIAYWVDASEEGKIKKLASFQRNSQFNVLSLCGLKDGFLWALNGSTISVDCYNLNLAIGRHIVDMSELLVSSIKLEGVTGAGYTVEKDNVLYLAGESGMLYCIDISTRNNPKVKSIIREQLCSGLELQGNAMLLKGNSNILLMDVTNALNPELKSRIKLMFDDAKFNNGYLYAGFQEMNVYDISNMSKPKLLKKASLSPYEISDFQFWGEYIFCRARTAPYFTPGYYPLIIKGNRF
jgi:hypothetical protein